MFCNKCGTQLNDDAKFCPYCGNAVQQETQGGAPAPKSGDAAPPPAGKPKRKRSKLPLVIVALVLVAGLAAGGYFLLGNGSGGGQGTPSNGGDWEPSGTEDNELGDTVIKEERPATRTVYLLASKTRTDDDGSETTIYTYDETSRTLTGTMTTEDGFDDTVETSLYDEYGQKLQNTLYEGGELQDYKEYIYDAEGNQHPMVWRYEDGFSWEYTYDDEFNLTEMTYQHGEYLNHYMYTYDANGNPLTQVQYDKEGAVFGRSEYTYDVNGNLLTQVQYDEEGAVSSRSEWTYDANGNPLTRVLVYISDGEVYSREEWTYDANGNPLTRVECTSDGEVRFREEWTYDASGNQLTHVGNGSWSRDSGRSGFYEEKYEYQAITFLALP